jgi:MtN3 and saliva related transmembrane protein
MLLEIFSVLVSIFGILMSVGHFPQAYKIYKNKSSKDVSFITYSLFFVGCFLWILYGIINLDAPIIVSFSVGLIGSFLVLFMKLKYR